LQTSDALGAAAAQLGPDAQAAVVDFNKQAGLSHGKISGVFQTLFGIPLSRGGSTQVVLRAGRRCEPVYASLCDQVQAAPWTALDETGWHVGGKNAWLHSLVSPLATVYVIDPTRSADPAKRVLGRDYAGVMIHDGWSPYDTFPHALHQQCLAHLLRRGKELLETATRGAVCFPRRLQALFHQALDLRDRHACGQLSSHGLAVARGRLESQLYEASWRSVLA
jgi:transposase